MSKILRKILNKKTRTIIGLLSGTSVDGIDAVLMRVTGSGTGTKVKILDFITHPVPAGVRLAIFRNSDNDTAKLDEICRLNVVIGALFSDTVLRLLRKHRLNAAKVDLIGSHGQTIHHLPERDEYLGYKVKSTLQIGDPAIIANLTGITTVGDFRAADCAVGGDGAPLVPFLDYVLFTHKIKNRALLNIGGIANITVLPKNAAKEKVVAFDTGPGNMLIDGMMYHLFRKPIDKNGNTAKKGSIDRKLLNYLIDDTNYRAHPPKSTGREHYGKDFQKRLLIQAEGVDKKDVIRTVTEFTAYSVWYNYNQFIEPRLRINELIISGGGAENPVIMRALKSYFKGIKVRRMQDYGITAKSKEAVLFGVLANECVAGHTANMKSVTGSARDVVLGKICQGRL
ncbi:MAG: anhydro-N-acetylmuramic acid kinase [Chlorobi bacterium]|nr:anhydro-N-acetylmuramic acid kinase [Chlorobiota bacterium]MCI0717079.1 anhydro-N-acetylmuramic acid kinase [Chlorobiota bacterium]